MLHSPEPLGRIQWGIVVGVPEDNPGLVVRRYEPTCSSPEEVAANFRVAEPEFHRLRQYGLRVLFGRPYLRRIHDGTWGAYVYTTRLEGEAPDPEYPPHEARLLRLGGILLRYYKDSTIGTPFLSDINNLSQYTCGHPYGQPRSEDIYLHDIDPSTMVATKPAINASLKKVRGWVTRMPKSEASEQLRAGYDDAIYTE